MAIWYDDFVPQTKDVRSELLLREAFVVFAKIYEGVSKSFRTESWRNKCLPLVLLVEKQHKGLWRQNSL
jgi:hypothetical protein